VKKLLILFCCFITVFAYSAPEKTKKVITFKADIASYQEVKSKNVFKGQGNAYLEIDDYKIYCEEIEIHFFKDKNGEDQIEKALFKTIKEGTALTCDLGGNSTTTEFTNAIIKNLP
jgi:hypothetical protein